MSIMYPPKIFGATFKFVYTFFNRQNYMIILISHLKTPNIQTAVFAHHCLNIYIQLRVLLLSQCLEFGMFIAI